MKKLISVLLSLNILMLCSCNETGSLENQIASAQQTDTAETVKGGQTRASLAENKVQESANDSEVAQLLESILGPVDETSLDQVIEVSLTVEEIDEVLHKCLEHLLTDPEINEFRENYLPADVRNITLCEHIQPGWPDSFEPRIKDFVFSRAEPDSEFDGADEVVSVLLCDGLVHNRESKVTSGKLVFMLGHRRESAAFYYAFHKKDDRIEVNCYRAWDP